MSSPQWRNRAKTNKRKSKLRDIFDKTKELKNLDHNHKYRNTVNKKAVVIIGDSIFNGIDQHGLSNESFKVRVKNHPEATTEDICDHLNPEIRKKHDVVIIHAETSDLTNNCKSLENYKCMADSVRSKLPNCKLAISNVIRRNDKNEIDKKVETLNIKLSKFCKKNKINIINNKNLDDSCLNYKQLHLNRKGNSYLANNFLDYLDCVWHGKFLPVSNSSNVSSIKSLYSLRKRYPQNIIISYLSINSLRNKLNDLKILISDSVDIFCIAKCKLDESFLNSEIELEGFKKPCRLDVNAVVF